MLLALFPASLTAGQELTWVIRDQGVQADPNVRLGSNGSRPIEHRNLAVDAAGSVYVSGTVSGPAAQDVVTMKLDANGALLWANVYDSGAFDHARAIAVDLNGNVYLLSATNSGRSHLVKYDTTGGLQWSRPVGSETASFNHLVADASGVYLAGRDAGFRIIKYDSAGAEQWSMAPAAGEAVALALDSAGNVYATGDFRVVKINSAGALQWNMASMGTGARASFDITLDGTGGVYVTGYRFNGASEDFLTIKLNAAGVQQWASTYDGGSWDIAFAVVADGAGNAWVTGQSNTPAEGDFVTVKYGASGEQQWVASYDAGGYDISYDLALDASGNVYVTGRSQQGNSGAFRTVKYDPAGDQQWVATYDAPYEDAAQAISIDASGDLLIAGTTSNPEGDLRVIKYDASGGQIWTAKEGVLEAPDHFGSPVGLSQTRRTLAVDASGNSHLAGVSFNGRNYDTRLIKVNGAGGRQWLAVLDNGADDHPVALKVDDAGNVYLLNLEQIASGAWNIHTLKFDPNGAELWRRVYDSGTHDLPGDLAVDNLGNVYVVGWSLGDILVIKYDASGNQQWVTHHDGGPTDLGNAVALDGSGGLVVSGSSQNPDLAWDLLTIKLDADGVVQWSAREIHETFGALAVDPTGNVYVVSGHADIQITKYDSNGARQWKTFHDGGSQEIPVGLALQGGNVHVSAFTDNGTDYDFRTLKYDAAGTLQWAASYDEGFEVAQALAVDGDGNVFVAGYSWNGSDNDARLVKYDSLGAQQWTRSYDNGFDDYGYAVGLDASGGVLLAGDSTDPTSGSDMVLLKYVEQSMTVQFSSPLLSVSERAPLATAPVVMTTSDGLPSTRAVTVRYNTVEGTALAGQDFQPASGTLEIPAGTPSGTSFNLDVPLLDDSADEEDETFSIHLEALGAMQITTILDNDTAGFAVSPRAGLRTTEAGLSDTFTIALTSQPSADVTLALESSDSTEGTVAPAVITFTPADWNLEREITVTGVDDAEVDGNASYSVLLHPAASADPLYGGLDPDDVQARNQDDDRGRRP